MKIHLRLASGFTSCGEGPTATDLIEQVTCVACLDRDASWCRSVIWEKHATAFAKEGAYARFQVLSRRIVAVIQAHKEAA